MIRVLQFADVINRFDFIDVIVQRADRSQFQMGVCLRSREHSIATPLYDSDTPRWFFGGTSRRYLPLTIWRLARLLRKWQVDILHTHHYEQALIGWWATRLNPATRLVVGRHYSDAIYRLPASVKRTMLLRLEQRVNRAAARVIVPSRSIFEILTQRQGLSGQKIDVIPYGFEPKKYVRPFTYEVEKIRKELELSDQLLLGVFGRLHEEKGHRFLLESVAALCREKLDLRLAVVGDGPERGAIERQVKVQGLGNIVQMLGWRKDAMAIMAAVDLVVQPTLHEAFSQVMIEALWMGRPLIITDVSGARDVITDKNNGIIVDQANPAALSGAILRLANDPELRLRLAQRGHESVQRFRAVNVVPLYEKSYKQSLNGKVGREAKP